MVDYRMPATKPPPSFHVDLYRTMRRIRAFDENVAELFEGGEIKGTAHS